MTSDIIKLSVDSRGVAEIVLYRPEKRNALSAEMISYLTEMVHSLSVTPDVRVIVLSGAGKVFCAGADLEWMMQQMHADRQQRMTEARKFATMLKALNEVPKPVIGKVHGGAFGGGVGLVSVCDSVIADATTAFALTETRLGLIPATIGPYVMARIGEGAARRVFMSGRAFDAAEARDLGLIADAVPAHALDAAVEAQVAPYLSAVPGAVTAAKALARYLGPRIDDEVIAETASRLADMWENEEAVERVARFLEKKA